MSHWARIRSEERSSVLDAENGMYDWAWTQKMRSEACLTGHESEVRRGVVY